MSNERIIEIVNKLEMIPNDNQYHVIYVVFFHCGSCCNLHDSDRHDRMVASVNTTDFIGNWSMGINSFAIDPPNAVLILDDVEQQRQDLGVIELYNPEYDSEANTLKYDITVEDATTTSIDLPSEFGQSTLVIDDDDVP
jgi:hypothetical protein